MVSANIENDKSSTVDNEVQIEIPPAEGELLTRPTYKVRIRIGLKNTGLHQTTCLLDTGRAIFN